jgi:UDPglucose 6-dehydrogenase
MKITILGSGYVGLVSGTCFSEFGFDVCCVDKDSNKIDKLKNNIIPIYEPGLENLVKKNSAANRLSFSNNINKNIKEADVVFIAVGTPARRGDGHADLSYVYEAAEQIAKNLSGYTLVVTKSTVPVGTGDEVKNIIKQTNPEANFDIVSNPEFLREGNAIEDFMRPDRVIVGCETKKAKAIISTIYKPLYLTETPIIFTDLKTAELIKYSANAFLAVKISYINQMADLCEKVGADIRDVARGIGLDKRIGSKFLHPGPGYGGSCFPKDTLALIETSKRNKTNISIVETVVKYNQQRKYDMAEKIITILKSDYENKKVSILGLAFKPETDDMRDSPCLDIIPRLQEKGIKISAFDPVAMDEAKKIFKDIEFAKKYG